MTRRMLRSLTHLELAVIRDMASREASTTGDSMKAQVDEELDRRDRATARFGLTAPRAVTRARR